MCGRVDVTVVEGTARAPRICESTDLDTTATEGAHDLATEERTPCFAIRVAVLSASTEEEDTRRRVAPARPDARGPGMPDAEEDVGA